jgi:hypothetical protein
MTGEKGGTGMTKIITALRSSRQLPPHFAASGRRPPSRAGGSAGFLEFHYLDLA